MYNFTHLSHLECRTIAHRKQKRYFLCVFELQFRSWNTCRYRISEHVTTINMQTLEQPFNKL